MKKGSIALTMVIIISGILLFAGISFVTSSIDQTQITKGESNLLLAQIRSNSCIEESLYKLKQNTNYTGTFTLSFSDGSCTSVITNSGGNLRNLSINSNVGNSNSQISKTVNISTIPFTVT